MLQLTRDKLDDIRLLVIALAVTAGILSWREAVAQGVMCAVAELPGDGVPCRLNNLGDVAGKAKKQATMWNRGTPPATNFR